MRPLVGTIKPEDYTDIANGVEAVRNAVKLFDKTPGLPVIVPGRDGAHEHRYWEYGSAISAIMGVFGDRMSEIEVLDVGCGFGVMGPSLVVNYNTSVTEVEPDLDICNKRKALNKYFKGIGKKPMILQAADFDNLPPNLYDVVTCISVIEHVHGDQMKLWAKLAARVKPGGVLFLTTDCVEYRGRPYMCDGVRTYNYILSDLQNCVGLLKQVGFNPIGEPDWNWNGVHVYDYTFWRGGFIKNGKAEDWTRNNVGDAMRNSGVLKKPS